MKMNVNHLIESMTAIDTMAHRDQGSDCPCLCDEMNAVREGIDSIIDQDLILLAQRLDSLEAGERARAAELPSQLEAQLDVAIAKIMLNAPGVASGFVDDLTPVLWVPDTKEGSWQEVTGCLTQINTVFEIEILAIPEILGVAVLTPSETDIVSRVLPHASRAVYRVPFHAGQRLKVRIGGTGGKPIQFQIRQHRK
jgi:hypothetical protein